MSFLILTATLFSLIIVGIYFAFRKPRKTDGSISEPEFFKKISENAREVHRKEYRNQCAKKFTRQWFAEYWRGQRSAFYAIWVWSFVIPTFISIMVVTLTLLVAIMPDNLLDMLTSIFKVMSFIYVIYVYMTTIIIWRCSNNSTPFFKYFIRFALLISVVTKTSSLYKIGISNSGPVSH